MKDLERRKHMMFKTLMTMLLFFILGTGCETVHQGAEKAGEAGGRVISVPNSISKGAAEGIKEKPKSNPYNR